ncbi:MAG: zinc-binding alcohol dehydrogenase [Myxococcota bacterium]
MTTATALWYIHPGHAEHRAHRVEEATAGMVKVRARFGAISRGTEALIFHRSVPRSEYERMRAPFQWGSLPDPVSYGYISVGEIEAGDPERRGQWVFCLYPHHTNYVVPGRAAIPIPAEIPPSRCVLAAQMETALNAVWDGDLRAGHRVQVVGAGIVGCLVARLARRTPGVQVQLVDRNPQRRALAERLGVEFALPEEAGHEFDLAFECSGAPVALSSLLPRLRVGASVVVLSWYGAQAVSLPLGAEFHSRRLRLISSQVGHVSPAMSHLATRERLALALRLLDDPSLDALVTDEVRFEDLPGQLPHLLGDSYRGICTRIRY